MKIYSVSALEEQDILGVRQGEAGQTEGGQDRKGGRRGVGGMKGNGGGTCLALLAWMLAVRGVYRDKAIWKKG